MKPKGFYLWDVGADYIITCNVRDFENSEVLAIAPDDFIKAYR